MNDVAHLCGALGRHEDALSMKHRALELCRRAHAGQTVERAGHSPDGEEKNPHGRVNGSAWGPST